MEPKKWHTLSAEQALAELKSSEKGLARREAEERLAKYGANELAEKRGKSSLELFLGQFRSVLVAVLVFAAAASFVLGEALDGMVISAIIVINALLGFYQERKAANALAALKRMTASAATVIRDGKKQRIDAKLLVPGDVIEVSAGDRVPADCRIIKQGSMKIDESMLTGESVPAEKAGGAIKDAALADRKNMAFFGTHAVYGSCTALVVGTGMGTEFGRIAEKLQEPEEATPLQRKLSVMGRQLSLIILAVAAAVFAVGYISGVPLFEMFLVSVALAVAAIPEGMPAIVTITLAVGLVRMSRKRAIVRRLTAVESLGSVTVICCDKTGTLTKNEMTVRKLYVDGGITDFGAISRNKTSGDKRKDAAELLLAAGMLCNNATETTGDPTEIALVRAGKQAGIEDPREGRERLAEVQFDSERKMMSAVYDINGRKMFTKGAVEEVLKRCSRVQKGGIAALMTNADRKRILDANHELTNEALRVLAFAYKPVRDARAKEGELIFIGLQAMMDPPRPEARDAIKKCYTAGIRVVMITGDHRNTAEAIARELGIAGRSITGEELDAMGEGEFEDAAESIAVYARTSPDQKVRITETLKKKGHIVAMSGDGVNDAPALKKADIGIAVGSGTDVTKEAADMVLTDDNFSTIVDAVEEGRGIYDNISKFVNYLLRANFAEVLVIFAAILMALPLPLLPLQLLWINLLTDGLPALALGVEPPEKDIMRRKPRDPKENILNRKSLILMAATGGMIAAGVLLLFALHLPELARAQTVAFTGLVVAELFVAASFRSFSRIHRTGFLANRKFALAVASSFALQLAVVYLPFMNAAFGTVPLGAQEWASIAVLGAAVFLMLEAMKREGAGE